jgi:hypothetical protein
MLAEHEGAVAGAVLAAGSSTRADVDVPGDVERVQGALGGT